MITYTNNIKWLIYLLVRRCIYDALSVYQHLSIRNKYSSYSILLFKCIHTVLIFRFNIIGKFIIPFIDWIMVFV